jgi:DNA-binding response OmpR family regulator
MNYPLVLIAEDEWAQADLYRIVLERAGFEVLIADTAAAFLGLLALIRPDLIVLDMHLPDMLGDQLLRRVRAHPHLGRARLIAATADPRFVEPIHAEFDLVLIKPVSPTQLRDFARRLCPP